ERVVVVRIELQHLVERFEGPIDEPAALEVEAKTQQHVRLFEPRQLLALQQALMNVDGARHLPLFTIETAEQQVNFERVPEIVGRFVQLFDGQIELVGDEKIQPENIVERLGHAPAVDQPPGLQLVALPRLADREAEQQTDQRRDKGGVTAQNNSVRHRSCRWRTPSTLRSSPATTSEVIFRCSMIRSACAASVDGSIAIG